MDELIKSHPRADNLSIDLASLSDKELEELEQRYKKICHQCADKD
ncbi:low affinity iron permease family protein [Legionella saoudiensis]|nr:low affinity iron permease family protein [Legionella saoudiensis]